MRRFAFLVLLALAALALFASSTPLPPDAANPVPALGTNVTISPTSRQAIQLLTRPTPDTYECSAILTTAEKSMALGDIHLVVAPGSRESQTIHSAGLDIQFSVSITSNADVASTELVVERSGTIISRSRSRVQLVGNRAAATSPAQP